MNGNGNGHRRVWTFGSLFTGIGGIDLGLERAGMRCGYQCEIDPFCNQVLAKRWPGVPKYGDITTIDPAALPPVDLVCGGFPCQPVSVAGRRRHTEDQRWLWPEFLRIIRGTNPRWVVAENVRGLLSADGGRVFGGIVNDLADAGYRVGWLLLRASDFGLPHRRERVFIIGRLADGDRERRNRESVRLQPRRSQQENAEVAGRCPHRDGRYPESRGTGVVEDSERDGFRARITSVAGHEGRGAFAGDASLWGPPGPGDRDGWARVLAVRPDLAPALESPVRGVADELPEWLHRAMSDRRKRLKALGNAVVPACAQYIGEMILEAERA